jgi:ATP-dependent exoDNAse (exonuclease V) beta subunit
MRDFIFSASNPPTLQSSLPRTLLYASFRNHAKYKEHWDKYLDPMFRKLGYLPLYELVSLIYGACRLFENFPDEQAFLSRFLDAVSSLESEGITGPRAFIEYASGSNEDKAAVFSIALPEYIDAVRVMTFHKSKGLGFSVVINLLFDEQEPPDPMYFEESGGAIHVYHITKAAAEVSAKLRPVYSSRKADSAVQDLNVLYVISTRARHELYNLFVKKIRKTPAAGAKLSDLFETYRSGAAPEPVERKKSGKPADPVNIMPSGVKKEERFEVLKPTYAGSFEKAEGELVHEILGKIGTDTCFSASGGASIDAGVKKLCRQCAGKYPFKFDEGKIVKAVSAFLVMPEVRGWFEPKKDREIFVEAEFIDKNGNLFRMDRVIIYKDKVTIIDFKTGGENPEKYSAQIKNYLVIVSEVYGKPAQGFLAYVDLLKVVPV